LKWLSLYLLRRPDMVAPGERRDAIEVLVVDDETLARRNLTLLLEGDPDIGEVTECESGVEALAAIQKSPPDLLFLDVQMPECDGFDVLELLGGQLPPAIIFVTAYDEYALRAFEAGALDYLLKPFDIGRFGRALNRAKEKIAHYPPVRPQAASRMVIKDRGQVLFLNIGDIDWVEAAGCYACLHVGNQTHIVRRTLQDLERALGEAKFMRIHRSIIANIERIQALELQSGGEYEVVLNSNVRLPLSRRFRARVQERLGAGSGRSFRDQKIEPGPARRSCAGTAPK
jgi:two-component system LytT family response regulator